MRRLTRRIIVHQVFVTENNLKKKTVQQVRNLNNIFFIQKTKMI
jgi:hypothetical protein